MLSIKKTGILLNANSAVIFHNIFEQKVSWISQKTSKCNVMQKKISTVDVENGASERPEETNFEYFNDFNLEYNEETNILSFQ